MEKIIASVGILTFNNEATIERTLESVRMFDDIIINDGGSTDKTLEIAARYGARIIKQDAKYKDASGGLRDFGGVRQQMLEAAKHDWFLYIDSDETISDGLREDIRAIVSKPPEQNDPLVYRVPIGIVLEGRQIKYSSNFPGYQHRFFNKKSGAHFVKPVHERIAFDAKHVKIGTLKHPWNTYTTREESRHYLLDMAGYRALQVKMSLDRSLKDALRYDIYRSLRASLGAFLKATRNYLLHGFKDTVPVSTEIGRIVSPLLLIGGIARARIARKWNHLFNGASKGEPELRLLPKLLARRPQGAFLDVGANEGAYVSVALKMLAPDSIYAFEPNPQYIAGLRAKFPGVHVEHLALSSEVGKARLKVPLIGGVRYATRSTLADVTEEGESSAEYIEVPTTTLDRYCEECALDVGVLKIDVEGHERAVLKGAQQMLKARHPMIIIEIEQRHHEEPIGEIFEELKALGYDGWFFDSVHACFAPISEFSVELHQSVSNFKTRRYVNNFIFLPAGASRPSL